MTSRFAGLARRGVLASLLLAVSPAMGQDQPPDQETKSHVSSVFGAQAEATRGQIDDAMRRLSAIIDKPPTDDPDGDLAAVVMGFHQTSIDVAQVILSTARDPQLRKLASEEISAESASVAGIRNWMENRVEPEQ